MSFTVGLIFLVALTVAVSTKFNLPVANTFMTVLLSVILLLYTFSILGYLWIGYCLIAGFSLLCLIYCVINHRQAVKQLFSAPMVILFLLILFSVFINSAVYTSDPEVIEYWMPGLLYILDNGKLPYSEPGLLPEGILHPPLLWLLQYFMLFWETDEIIATINNANNILVFACILPFFGDDKPQDRYDVMLLVVKFVLVFGLVGTDNGFVDLSVGRLFALLFGYGIYVAMTKPCNKKFELIELSCILSGVMLLNSTGFAFSFVILFVARLMAFFSSPEKNVLKKTYRAAKEHFTATVVLTLTSLSFVLLLYISGNTDPTAAISSVFNALDDFMYRFPYTLTVLAILLLPALSHSVDEGKRLKI